ncbi:unnamed protein product [Polarella glacialis]|uniref:Small ribosomal subunit protein mS35 mitochondrial conserved domain-containing protein n=2 Tax=Polarella glacialis TaxID=89957 RepID=A0A813GAH5_POLGL|nr:unnamed protein product [Polarella glacialis]
MWRSSFGSILRSSGATAARAAGPPGFTGAFLPELEPAGLLAPLQVRWAKKGKRKKLPKRGDRTAELQAASGGAKERIFDNVMEPETTYQMSLTVKQHMRGIMSDGRHNARRKKDLTRYTNYRVARIAGLTHDRPQEETDRRGFVSPLTDLQDSSNLPRSANHRRFSYPHTLSYKVYWGPPSVQDTPNEYEGSMVGCTVSVRLSDLPLTQRQKERLIDIVGQDRIDEETGVFALEADTFLERNQNAALLGDMMEQLLREAKLADDLIPSSEFDGADYGAPGTRPVE